jgi:hypothetical protein
VNAALGLAFDLVLAPLLFLPPLAAVLAVSVLTGAAMLWVVARTSDQARITATKRALHAALFEIRLFNDDLPAVLRAVGDMLGLNARYLGLSLVPLAWVAVPLLLVVAQLQAFYGWAGLAPGAPALVTVTLRTGTPRSSAGSDTLSLRVPQGIRVETEAVHLAGGGEVLWRIVPETAGEYTLAIATASGEVAKTLHVSGADEVDRPARRSPERVSGDLVSQVLYPSEPPIDPATGIAAIAVRYPEPGLEVFGTRVHWLIVYVAVSMAAAFVLARRFGVAL